MKNKSVAALAMAIAIGAAPAARAVTIFDSFSSGSFAYDSETVNRVEAPSPYDDTDVACRFTVGAGSDMFLTTVEAPFQRQSGAAGTQLHFWLMADNGNSPGTILAQTNNVTVADHYPDSSVYSVEFPTAPTISAGGTYWLGASADSSNSRIGWHLSFSSGTQGIRENGGTWTIYNPSTINAFRLSGTAVPEPSPALLLLAGLGLLLRNRALPALPQDFH